MGSHGAIGGQRIDQNAVLEGRDAGAGEFRRTVGVGFRLDRLVQRLGEIGIAPGFDPTVRQALIREFFAGFAEQWAQPRRGLVAPRLHAGEKIIERDHFSHDALTRLC